MKPWTVEDIQYLQESWGNISIPKIAKNLGRTINAIKIKSVKLGLGRHLFAGEEITFLELCRSLGRFGNYNYYKVSWPKHGLPVKFKKSIKKKYMVIRIDDFWKWAEKNKQLLDFSKFQENSLGKEPSWVAGKRRADIAAARYKNTPWTSQEDQYLISLLNQFKYGYREISEKCCRTEGAIKRRIFDLKLKQRPVKADNHNPWESRDIEKVKTMYFDGCSPEIISTNVDRSACAVRGLLERLAKNGELVPPVVTKPTPYRAGTSYRQALPREEWPKAEKFLAILSMAKQISNITGQRPDIDMNLLRNAYASI